MAVPLTPTNAGFSGWPRPKRRVVDIRDKERRNRTRPHFHSDAASEALSRRQHTELVSIGIRHDHPAHLALADVDASRPEGGETIDLCLLITAEWRSDVEVQPVLAGFGHEGGPPQVIFGPPWGERMAVSWS